MNDEQSGPGWLTGASGSPDLDSTKAQSEPGWLTGGPGSPDLDATTARSGAGWLTGGAGSSDLEPTRAQSGNPAGQKDDSDSAVPESGAGAQPDQGSPRAGRANGARNPKR